MTGSWAPHWKFRSHWKFPHWRRTSPESAPQSRWRPEKASATPVRPLNTGRLNILVCAHWICQNRLLRQQNEHEKVWRHCLHWEVVYADYELGPILCPLGKWNSEIDALICNKAKLQSKYIRVLLEHLPRASPTMPSTKPTWRHARGYPAVFAYRVKVEQGYQETPSSTRSDACILDTDLLTITASTSSLFRLAQNLANQ
ncbi:unnamed protein product, partial [Nesidiocoris tenuis]